MRTDSEARDILSSAQYKLILDSLSEGVCTINREWTITSFNRSAQLLFGVSELEAIGRLLGDLFHCEVCECQTLLAGVMAKGTPVRDVATRIMDQQGHPIPVVMNATPFRNGTDEINGLVISFRDNRPLETLRRELRQSFSFQDMVSRNAQMNRIFHILPTVAESDSAVLILGASGTGKELLARAIHQASSRAKEPFIAVNCGALPDNLLESELFGYKKGAFTDARIDKLGRFALAEGGTLFLDEIGDTSPAMQVKLLRVLQEREYEPLGSTHSVTTNIRLITATNRDLSAHVADNSFRADLYYRINVISFDLPALVKRPEDIPLLVAHFIETLNAEQGRTVRGVSQQAMERLLHYDYPGNVRELRNIIERAYVLCRCDEIQEQCLPPHLLNPVRQQHAKQLVSESAAVVGGASHYLHLRQLTPQQEQALIEETLTACQNSRKQTAARLGIDPATLWRKMKKYGLLS